MAEKGTMTYEEFVKHATEFVEFSDQLRDEWRIHNSDHQFSFYIKKETFVENNGNLLKAEYVISYNMSYAVPMFAFNFWHCSGVLLTLDEIREMAVLSINKPDFYSVITQQEHPLFFCPYYTVHPCHTAGILSNAEGSRNQIVTFLSIISPIVKLNVPMGYGNLDVREPTTDKKIGK